ncbi:MAG TPA: hypothetical protein PK280_01015, partial [Planctomycetota bacterium]|nr:hypothetical protein [Planctomycetota bacterium]
AALVFSRRHKPSEVLGTRCLLNDARLACENFRLEHGQYPWPKPPAVTRALAADPVADVAIRGQQVYAEVRGHSGATINTAQDYLGDVRKTFLKNGALVDSWGREIRFRVNFSGLQAVIWSCGPNGIDETNDGDSPDPAKYPKGYYWFGKGDTGDDITNL